jgi:hypothetical protein
LPSKGESEERKKKTGWGEREGSHYMVTEKVLVTIKGNQKRRGKKMDGGLW